MTTLSSTTVLFFTYFMLALANKDDESLSDPAYSASTIELKRIPRPVSDISMSESVLREQRALPEYQHDVLDSFESIPKRSVLRSDNAVSNNGIFSGAEKPAKKSGQTSSKTGGYGYPYRMAPTLPPFLKHISDRHEDESESISPIAPTVIIPSRPKIPHMPRMPSMPKISAEDDDGVLTKRTDTLKKRQGSAYDDDSSEEYSPISSEYSSYREPKYRNSYDLDEFSPRQMYYESGGPYSRPAYKFPTLKPTPPVSPRDPYLSPSSEPIDGFYPKVKNNAVSYSSYGKRDKYYKSVADPPPPPPRGYDDSDDFSDFSSEEDDYPPGQGGYEKGPKYSEPYPEPDPYSEPPPPKGSGADSDYGTYNSPITGMTRQRLLEYAGASDLYQGEPDYLKSASVRKTKFTSIQDDYSPYPRSRSYTFADYHVDESRRISSRVKRQVAQEEQTVPKCSRNSALPMCLTDGDYPTDEVRKIVSKNMKFLSQLKNTRLEIKAKKSTKKDPESLEDLEKNQSMCSSKKGLLYPKRAKDTDGIWRTVVNVDDVKQSIEVDVCRSAEIPCDYVPAAIPTKCVQKFSFVTLITFNPKDNTLEDYDFPVPSACSCSVGRPTRIRLE